MIDVVGMPDLHPGKGYPVGQVEGEHARGVPWTQGIVGV